MNDDGVSKTMGAGVSTVGAMTGFGLGAATTFFGGAGNAMSDVGLCRIGAASATSEVGFVGVGGSESCAISIEMALRVSSE